MTNSTARDAALSIVRRLRDAGHVAYFAGGCVRDVLLGREPTDYDVATDATPDRVRELFRRTQAVGAAFGVILVREIGWQIEVATFRSDLKYIDGRRPEGIVFTNAENDAKRRDFTINGLFFDPIEQKVIDFVGGQADLQRGLLRAIGNPNERFEEDHLRLLRAVRFAARFGLQVDADTRTAIVCHADHLRRISPERIADELRRMLTPATRGEAYRLLRDTGLMNVILRFLPEATSPANRDAPNVFLAVEGEEISFGLSLAALVLDRKVDIARLLDESEIKRSCNAMRQALKISNEETDAMAGALSFGHLLEEAPPSVAQVKRFLARGTSPDARLLMNALAACGFFPERVKALSARLLALDGAEIAPPPFITGEDLTAAGLIPGKMFKIALDAAYDAQLESRVTSKDEALKLAVRIVKG